MKYQDLFNAISYQNVVVEVYRKQDFNTEDEAALMFVQMDEPSGRIDHKNRICIEDLKGSVVTIPAEDVEIDYVEDDYIVTTGNEVFIFTVL